jgi:hypothetical protein
MTDDIYREPGPYPTRWAFKGEEQSMAKHKTKQPANDGVMEYQINEHKLSGVCRGGLWYWTSTVPGVDGCMTMDDAVGAFTKYAIAGAVTVKRLAEGGDDA